MTASVGVEDRPPIGEPRPATLGHMAGAVWLAAVMAIDPSGWYPFGPAKWLAVSVAVMVAVTWALWIGRRACIDRPVGLVIVWLIGGLLAWLALAAALGRDPLYAWTGTPERRLGLLTWLLLAAIGWVGACLDARERWMVRRWAVVAAVWCGGYALVERFAGRPVDYSGSSDRLGGPFGSAAYLGAAACLLLPLAIGVASDAGEGRTWRWSGGVAALLGGLALVGSGSRAAWVGLAVAGAAVVVRRRLRPGPLLLAAAGLGVALLLLAPRLDDVLDRSVSSSSRLDEWSMATGVLADHWLVGTGPEGYRTALADGVTADYEQEYGRDVLPDRAHNGVLDVALAGGVPAGAMYAALIVIAACLAWRALAGQVGTAAFGAAVLAYLVQQLFLFPLAELDPMLWMLLGTLVTSHRAVDAPALRSRRWPALAAAAAAVALFGSGVLGVAADRAAGQLTLAGARRAAELRPDVVRYHLLQGAAAAATGTVAGYDEAVAAADSAVAVSPHDPLARLAAAQARFDLARVTGDGSDVAEALQAWEQLVDDDPVCRACQYGLGLAAALADDAERARAAWVAAADLSRPGDRRAADALAALDAIGSP